MSVNVAFCDAILLTEEGLTIGGWAISGQIPCSDLKVEAYVNGSPVAFSVSYFDRPDVRQTMSIPDGLHGYRLTVNARHAYEHPKTALELFFSNGESRWPATMNPPTNELRELDFNSKDDFLRRIQNPATRTKNKVHQVYGACKAIAQFPRDKYVEAAALCLFLHRREDLPDMIDRLDVLDRAAAFCEGLADDGSGLFVRWKISLSTALGLHFVRAGDFERAFRYFSQIQKIADAERRWPQMIFSILSALLFCGWCLYRRDDKEGAIAVVGQSESLFRRAVASLQFSSWYSFDELVNANRAAQQCAVLLAMCRGSTSDEFMIPDEFRNVNFGRLNADWRRAAQIQPELAN